MICIGFSLLLALGFLSLFLWAVRNGQFEDQLTPSIRMLFDSQTHNSPAGTGSKASKESSSEGVPD